MKYFLFLDESGDHGLKQIDQGFPVFVLCGILISEVEYKKLNDAVNKLKNNFWSNAKVILHSRDIRKCQKEFQILLDLELKEKFYKELNTILSSHDYKIIAAGIKKEEYVKNYGKQSDNVYEIALSFILERTVFCLDDMPETRKELHIAVEKRGRKEDQKLEKHMQLIKNSGTHYVKPERFENYSFGFHFRGKNKNVNGLQISDLIAYPIARYIIDSERANPSFDLIKDKFHSKEKKIHGLKIFP